VYLRDCHFENCGPISSIDLSLGFDHDDHPKPLLLVGENGAGKTIMMSMVADALALLGQRVFEDIISKKNPIGTTYLRAVGPATKPYGAPYALGLLRFSSGARSMYWHEKTGVLDVATLLDGLRMRFEGVSWPTDGNGKDVSGALEEKDLTADFGEGVHVFFPASRGEAPSWLNSEALRDQPRCKLGLCISGLSSKPIVVESSQSENMDWIMDVILDSRVEVVPNSQGGYDAVTGLDEIARYGRQKRNVEEILAAVLRKRSVKLAVAAHTNRVYRLCVMEDNKVLMPSLAGLSAGEASLFNIFCTILRYGDRPGIPGGPNLAQINGMVLIDEVDAHLHTDLQLGVLPRLLHMFPDIQFIISSHSPVLVLGMEREFGKDGVNIIVLPSGEAISAEEFSELQALLLSVESTSEFQSKVESAVTAAKTPLVLVEGETDVRLIGRALKILGRDQVLQQVELAWVGSMIDGGTHGGGKDQLTQVTGVLINHPGLCHRRVLLLYDSDATKIKPRDTGCVSIRLLPKNASTVKVSGGIENLFSDEILENRFFSQQSISKNDGYGVVSTIDKAKFCDYVCQSLEDRNAFSGFEDVAAILEEFIGTPTSGS
jgi:hypothetical protein